MLRPKERVEREGEMKRRKRERREGERRKMEGRKTKGRRYLQLTSSKKAKCHVREHDKGNEVVLLETTERNHD